MALANVDKTSLLRLTKKLKVCFKEIFCTLGVSFGSFLAATIDTFNHNLSIVPIVDNRFLFYLMV